jgi:hypothetical protein
VKRTTVFLLALAMSLSVWAQTAQAPVGTNAATITAVPVASQFDQGNPDVKVWVNTASGVYHCPGTRWYGTTKRGEYMTQAEAQKKGFRPAYGKVCR